MRRPIVVLALCGADASGKTTACDELAAVLPSAMAFHHKAPRVAGDEAERAKTYAAQRATIIEDLAERPAKTAPRIMLADRWWPCTLALSIVVADRCEKVSDALSRERREVYDAEHDRIARVAREMRGAALEERERDGEAPWVRVVPVYLRATADVLRARTSPARRGKQRLHELVATVNAYEALRAQGMFQHEVDASLAQSEVHARLVRIATWEMSR